MIDMGVPDSLKQNCAHLRDNYKQAIKIRQQLKCELESRVLPTLERSDTHSGFDEDQLELLEHWIDELGEIFRKIAIQLYFYLCCLQSSLLPPS